MLSFGGNCSWPLLFTIENLVLLSLSLTSASELAALSHTLNIHIIGKGSEDLNVTGSSGRNGDKNVDTLRPLGTAPSRFSFCWVTKVRKPWLPKPEPVFWVSANHPSSGSFCFKMFLVLDVGISLLTI